MADVTDIAMKAGDALVAALPVEDAYAECHEAYPGVMRVTIKAPGEEEEVVHSKLDVYEDHVLWFHLRSLDYMKAAHGVAREVFLSKGLYLLAEPADDKARKTLLQNGEWEEDAQDPRRLKWSASVT